MKTWKKIVVGVVVVGGLAAGVLYWLSQRVEAEQLPGEIMTDFYPIDGKMRIDFRYELIPGGVYTWFVMPFSGYSTKTFKEELIALNGPIISTVAVWNRQYGIWNTYTVIGPGYPIAAGDIVQVAVKSLGAYWEY